MNSCTRSAKSRDRFIPTETIHGQEAPVLTGLYQLSIPRPLPLPALCVQLVPGYDQLVPCLALLVSDVVQLVPCRERPAQGLNTAVTRITSWAVHVGIYLPFRLRLSAPKGAKLERASWDWNYERSPVIGCWEKQGITYRRNRKILDKGNQNVSSYLNVLVMSHWLLFIYLFIFL